MEWFPSSPNGFIIPFNDVELTTPEIEYLENLLFIKDGTKAKQQSMELNSKDRNHDEMKREGMESYLLRGLIGFTRLREKGRRITRGQDGE